MDKFGKIIAILPERSGTSAKGNPWRSVSYVLETQEQYPKRIVFDVVNDKIDQFSIQQGEMLQVHFDIDAREYQGKWFNSIQAWKVVRQQYGGYRQQPQGGYQQPGQQWATNNPQAGAQAIPQAAQQAMRTAAPPQPQGSEEGLPF